MDNQVIRAMQRWPNVPKMYGWLRLDRRGNWFLIDRNQADFDTASDTQGSPISNQQIIGFISRNYQADQHGCWFWQNGPQRVFVNCDSAPLIVRVITTDGGHRLLTTTGQSVNSVSAAYCDTDGALLIQTDRGPAVVHDLDLAALDIEAEHVSLLGQLVRLNETDDAEKILGFVASPREDSFPDSS